VERFSVIAGHFSDLLELDCANESKGCKEKLLRPDIINHENICIYTENIDCPLPNCLTKVSFMNCNQHLLTVHGLKSIPSVINVGVHRKIEMTGPGVVHIYGHWCYSFSVFGVVGTADHLLLGGLKSASISTSPANVCPETGPRDTLWCWNSWMGVLGVKRPLQGRLS